MPDKRPVISNYMTGFLLKYKNAYVIINKLVIQIYNNTNREF